MEPDGFDNNRILEADQQIEVFLCFTGLDQVTRNLDMVNYTTSTGVPVAVKPNSPVYLPIVCPESPIPFPTLNLLQVHLSGQEPAESYSVISNPVSYFKNVLSIWTGIFYIFNNFLIF